MLQGRGVYVSFRTGGKRERVNKENECDGGKYYSDGFVEIIAGGS